MSIALVERFAELQAGMEVLVMACGICGKTHRYTICDLLSRTNPGTMEKFPGWSVRPDPLCGGPFRTLLAPGTVAQRRVFRFVHEVGQGDVVKRREKVPAGDGDER
jgi:hypothetical protein